MAEGAPGHLHARRVFLQSKIPGRPEDITITIDHHRKVFNTDYVDSMLHPLHDHATNGPTVRSASWTATMKRTRKSGFVPRAVSCHSLPALRTAVDVGLDAGSPRPRQSPEDKHTDGMEQEVWNLDTFKHQPHRRRTEKNMRAKDRGVIGMKICGNGELRKPEDREKCITSPCPAHENAVVIGFKNSRNRRGHHPHQPRPGWRRPACFPCRSPRSSTARPSLCPAEHRAPPSLRSPTRV